MEPDSMRRRLRNIRLQNRVDLPDLGAWLLVFGLVVFLGLEGGGYDPLVHGQVGIAAWWAVLALVAVGALPRRRLAPPGLAALGLLTAFAAWTALSLIWTESVERSFDDVARVTTYLGVFGLVLLSRGRADMRKVAGAVAAGIVGVVTVALLSRMFPDLFSGAKVTDRLLDSHDRLSYPLNYWNALAAICGIGIPLLLQAAAGARSVALRALAAAALPALVLALYLTLSRGGIAAAAIAAAIYLGLAADRVPRLLTLLLAAGGGAVLVVLAHAREALREGLTTPLAHDQGTELFWLTLLICLLVGAAQAGLALLGRRAERPAWSRPTRHVSAAVVAVLAVAVVIVAVVGDAPGRAADAWDEFKEGGGPGQGTERLGSAAGENRYQFWSAAVDENATAPLIGTGSGTFQLWWQRHGDGGETVRDAHSLYMQTLGELGIVGLALLAAFLALILGIGCRRAIAAGDSERSWLAAGVAGVAVFTITALVDWMWQIPAVPVAALLLATALVAGAGAKPRLPVASRVAVGAVAAVAIVAIAIPLAADTLIRESQAEARAGDLQAALDSARSAQNVEPGAAGPRLQRALVLELAGDLAAAEAAALEATDREPTNWRNWLVLSRVAAERGRADASVAAYEEARVLNPDAEVFRRIED